MTPMDKKYTSEHLMKLKHDLYNRYCMTKTNDILFSKEALDKEELDAFESADNIYLPLNSER
jgi:hypothetical protein